MTPKEKAEQLIDKHKPYVYCYGGGALSDPYNEAVVLKMAKQCAIIAVDEIINNVLVGIDLAATWGDYWVKVKQELEKL